MRSIIIIIRQPLERIPPIINLIDVLTNNMEKQVILICKEVSTSLKLKYSERVEFVTFDIKIREGNFFKIISWLIFRHKVFSFLKSNRKRLTSSILWIGSADAALALGKKLFQYKYIFQCHELYDAFPLYKKGLKKVMQNALVNVNPEDNRGAIFRSWYKLNETPVTLPNKPYYHPKEKKLEIKDTTTKQIIEKIRNKKILIYQGGIVKERDVNPIAEALKLMEDDQWVLVLMGNTDKSTYLNDLLYNYPKTIYIPIVPAPDHLQITSWARIGVVSYTFDDLNHVFCAPNKTWEYTGFGIPLLANNVPGLMNDIKKYGSGEIVNMQTEDINTIINAINKIDHNYSDYSKNAMNFYNSFNIAHIISNILQNVNGKY